MGQGEGEEVMHKRNGSTLSDTLVVLILLVSVGLNVFLVTKCYTECPNWSKCKIVVLPENDGESIPSDSFLGKVVDFYQSLVNYQFAIVSIVLVLGFIYSYLISTRHARNVLDEEIYSEHFREHYLPHIKELGREIIKNALYDEEIFDNIDELQKRIEKIERAIDQLGSSAKRVNTKLVAGTKQKSR